MDTSTTSLLDDEGYCFYGINIDNESQFLKICHQDNPYVNQTSSSDNVFDIYATSIDMDFLWILVAGALVFFMQTGFTLLESGMVKHTNVQNILFKNVMDACIGSITWFLFGYCIAFGDNAESNGFIGIGNVALQSEDYNAFFFQWAFAATAATIVSGSVAERTTLHAYFLYTAWLTTWVYPIVVHWMWSGTGWMSPFNVMGTTAINGGVIDFAGSGVVHMVGGWSGLMGALALGPRFLRFDKTGQAPKHLKHSFKFGHNVPFQVLGTLILWFGWYGFNGGSTLCASDCMTLASKIAVNTTLAAAMGGITVALVARVFEEKWFVPAVCNGTLAGLVSITAACSVVSPWASIIIGFLGGCFYYGSSHFLEWVRVDDPLDAWCVHGVCGFWAVIAVGIFAYDSDAILFGGYSEEVAYLDHGYRFGIQLMAAVVIVGWVCLNSGGLFFILKAFGVLRITKDDEQNGLDINEHGGKGYHYRRAYSLAKGQQLPIIKNNKIIEEEQKENDK